MPLLRKDNKSGINLVRMELDLVESETVTSRINLHCSGLDVEFYRYSTVGA